MRLMRPMRPIYVCRYSDAVVKSGAKFDILVAAPRANGFLGARGIMGHVPAVYTHLLSRFWGLLKATGRAGAVSLREWQCGTETFHAKGIWGYPSAEAELPSFTFIGSPNFGLRSSNRDLECQVAVFTANSRLKADLHAEQEALYRHGRVVDDQTFRQPGRGVKGWEKVATKLIRGFF